MSKEIDVQNGDLMKLFSENNFIIPSYQRQYVWNEENIKELLQDIYEASLENEGKNEYFLGSLVCQHVNDSLEILDGQQRLTTLFLIFHSMRNIFINEEKNRNFYEALDGFLHQKENEALDQIEKNRFDYTIRKDVKNLFDKLAKNESIDDLKLKSNISIENVINNLNVANEFFKKEEIDVKNYYKYLTKKVKIITITTEDLDNAFRIFSVLNNRGVQLQNADLIKADNIGAIDDSKKIIYSTKWEDLENYFEGDFDRYLSLVRLILIKEKAKLNLYSEYKNYFDKNSNTKGITFIDKLDSLKSIYEKTVKLNDNSITNKTKNLLTIMHYLPHNDWISAIMSYYYKFGNNKFDQFVEVFDYMISTDNIIGYDITTKIKSISQVLSEIDASKNPIELLDNTDSALYDIDKKELQHALNQEIYRKRVSTYIMLKIEFISRNNHDAQIGNFKKLSIEHIFPQNPQNIKDWDFANEVELVSYRNKIGNLVLLNTSKNSSLSNSTFEIKKEKYLSNDSIDIFEETKKVYCKDRKLWTLQDIKFRQKIICEWIIANKKTSDWAHLD